ncbi:MAG: hypothetical protein OXJ37_05980 [Bryobacterales bacterium]|nr:hypothetical protein [Bryobacterales bacterium]MDE0261937.1 hypothetical protein [Bryobacterales bacterium]MDE0621412.1 hypothetical protein [Bryobacterales bacterium]
MKQAVPWTLAAILAAGGGDGATMSGSVRTPEGNEIASTITVLSGSVGADVTVHETGADGAFSI